jgi:hypothetical protein
MWSTRQTGTCWEALALWRGPLLQDAADDLLRNRVGQGLEEQRLTAIELRVEAELEAGQHEALVPELADLCAAHPSRERLIAARMTALHRCGRGSPLLPKRRQRQLCGGDRWAGSWCGDPGFQARHHRRLPTPDHLGCHLGGNPYRCPITRRSGDLTG